MSNWWFAWMKHFNSSKMIIRYESNSQYLLANFSHNENNLFFIQFCSFVLGHQIKDTSSITKLQENINIIAIISIFNWRFINSKQVWMRRNRTLIKLKQVQITHLTNILISFFAVSKRSGLYIKLFKMLQCSVTWQIIFFNANISPFDVSLTSKT